MFGLLSGLIRPECEFKGHMRLKQIRSLEEFQMENFQMEEISNELKRKASNEKNLFEVAR